MENQGVTRDKVRLGIIGLGWIGTTQHARAAVQIEGCQLVAVSDVNPSAEKTAEQFHARFYPDCREMLDKEKLDGVVVATPTHLHASIGVECAKRGLHLLMEKPIASTLEESDKLIEAARENKVRLLVGHHRRFNPYVEEMRRIVTEGQLGKLVGMVVLWALLKSDDYYEPAWRRQKGAGPITNNVIHDIDVLRVIGGGVSRVYAEKSHEVRKFEVEDTGSITLRFVNGAIANIFISDAVPSPWADEHTTGEITAFPQYGENCYYVFGTQASLSFPHLKKVFYPDPIKRGWREPLAFEEINVPFYNPYEKQMKHFIKVIKGEENPMTTGEDARRTLEVILSVFESCETGQPIDLK